MERKKILINKNTIINTVKICAAAIMAIIAAELLHLEYYVSAGIVAVLSVQPTKKETVKTAASRLLAFVAAMLIAAVCFNIMGITTEAFFVYLIIFIFVCQIFSWNSAMAMDSVLISHFLSSGEISVNTALNECLIFVIGVGFGIIVNLHLHKNTDYVEKMKEETDELIKRALHRMAQRIVNQEMPDYDGSCFTQINKSVREAKSIAEENYMNQFGSRDMKDIDYISMRERQVHVLYEMYKRVSSIKTLPITAKTISDFLEKTSREYHKDNSVKELFAEFCEMDKNMKASPLPVERGEFEDRAQLYTLMRYIEEFLKIKIEFFEKSTRN